MQNIEADMEAGDNSTISFQLGDGFLDLATKAMPHFKDFLAVASIAIPPPGGQVISAVLQICHMVLLSRETDKNCKILGLRAIELTRIVFAYDKDQQGISKKSIRNINANPALREVVMKFLAVTKQIRTYVANANNMHPIWKVVKSASTTDQLAMMEKDLADVRQDLDTGAIWAMLHVVAEGHREKMDDKKFFNSLGGADEIASSSNKIAEVIGALCTN